MKLQAALLLGICLLFALVIYAIAGLIMDVPWT